jgi:hypothetical protein
MQAFPRGARDGTAVALLVFGIGPSVDMPSCFTDRLMMVEPQPFRCGRVQKPMPKATGSMGDGRASCRPPKDGGGLTTGVGLYAGL